MSLFSHDLPPDNPIWEVGFQCKKCVELQSLLTTRDAEIESAREAKDGAYFERNRLVSFLSKLYPSHLARHDEADTNWEDAWRWIVCVHAPFGQLTWHIHDSHYFLFTHLLEKAGDWDGHSTEEKYQRLASFQSTAQPKEDWKRVKGCWNKFEKVTKPPASDTPEKPKDFIEQFRLYFANLARKYPERTLFTEGRDPIQDELVGLHHLAESSDTPARPEWVDELCEILDLIVAWGGKTRCYCLSEEEACRRGGKTCPTCLAQEALVLLNKNRRKK